MIQLIERPLDEYRNQRGVKKTRFWRDNKAAIIAQGQEEERRARRSSKKKH